MVSEANLVLIAVMVVIFGAALLIRFPDHRARQPCRRGLTEYADEPATTSAHMASPLTSGLGDDADAAMWTSRLRRRALRMLPPGKLLPDRQPAYVASWIYVFGVATLAALGVVIVSGFALALGGPDWWHTDAVGHFFNSLHLWSVEAFMAFMVIHLWGKFWMAAWRGRRAVTWVTGVVAFVASVVECFTGYLSQQNFDSQWISTSGKDAFDAVGVGAFLQPDELRPDADVAHRAHPARARRRGRRPRAGRAGTGRCPPAARPSRARAGPPCGPRPSRTGPTGEARLAVTTS